MRWIAAPAVEPKLAPMSAVTVLLPPGITQDRR
jgi:hypothetical protein